MKQSTAVVIAGSLAFAGIVALLGAQVIHPPGICSASTASARGGVSLAAANGTLTEFIDVRLAGDVRAVDEVRLCTPQGCSFAPGVTLTPAPNPALTPAPTPTPQGNLGIDATRLSAGEWRFVLQGRPGPSAVTITAFDSADRTLATEPFHAHWTRYALPTSCGDVSQPPSKPLVLTVPAT